MCIELGVFIFILRTHSEWYIDYIFLSEDGNISAHSPMSPTIKVSVSQTGSIHGGVIIQKWGCGPEVRRAVVKSWELVWVKLLLYDIVKLHTYRYVY